MTVSVIVPIYNAEYSLSRCLDSALSQTLPDLELICVDDGSTDGTAALLRDYAARDSRIVLLRQEHTGAGPARNLGMASARGEYLFFLDADDAMEPDLLESAVARARETDAEIVLFGYLAESVSGARAKEVLFSSAEKLLASREEPCFSRNDFPDRLFSFAPAAPWCKLYRRDFVCSAGLSFQDLPNRNDLFFYLTSFAAAERIAYLSRTLYRYRRLRRSLEDADRQAPMTFMAADLAARDWMTERGLFDQLALSWQNQTVSDAYSVVIRPVYTTEIRMDILRQLRDGPLAGTGWLDFPEENAPLEADKVIALRGGMDYAIPVYASLSAAEGEGDLRCLRAAASGAPTVSVLMPVYNAAPYLEEALDSVLAGNQTELEVICVNDGSSDGSEALLLSRAEKDPRIAVWSQSNRGVSCTRDTLVGLARGKYLYFLDGDDRLVPGALDRLVARAEEDRLELLLFFMEAFTDSEYTPDEFSDYYTTLQAHRLSELQALELPSAVTGPELFTVLKERGVYFCNPVLRLVRRDWLTSLPIRFIPGIVHEDDPHAFAEIMAASRAGLLAEPLYQRRLHKDSIMTEGTGFRHAYGYAVGAGEMLRAALSRPEKDRVQALMISHVRNVMDRAQAAYAKLSEAERRAEWGIPSEEKLFLFRTLVTDNIASDPEGRKNASLVSQLRDRLENTKERLESTRERLDSTRGKLEETKGRLEETKTALANTADELNDTRNKLLFRTDELKQAKQNLRRTREKLADITTSTDYLIGRKIMVLPHKITALVKKIKK